MIIKLLTLLILIGIATTAVATDAIYRCTDEKGNPAFSDTSCEEIGNAIMPDHEVFQKEFTRIEQINRHIAATKREIMDQQREKEAALARVHTREEAVEDIPADARTLEKEYDNRIKDLRRDLAALKQSRN
ncbi:MAG: DUF4124 domain-containing protein, partial [Pseudomonadales bacterium]